MSAKISDNFEQEFFCDKNIGNNLRELRNRHNLSQKELCTKLQHRGFDIDNITYKKYENGEPNVQISVIIELKKIFNCSYDDFFKGL